MKRERAFELDLLRGIAVVMMMLHHFAFDLRFEFGLPLFAFIEKPWFIDWVRLPFVMVFLVVSGICGSFTRSNAKRGLRLLVVALLFTAATSVYSVLSGDQEFIFFNVLHLLAVGTLLYATVEAIERRRSPNGAPTRGGDAFLVLFAAVVLWAQGATGSLGIPPSAWHLPFFWQSGAISVSMGDYMPMIPWLGFFLIGIVIGRTLYITRTSAFPRLQANTAVQRGTAPVRFVGRHALAFYVLHQPVLLGVLYLLHALGAF